MVSTKSLNGRCEAVPVILLLVGIAFVLSGCNINVIVPGLEVHALKSLSSPFPARGKDE